VADDDAPRIALADAKKDFDAGAAIFIDSRGEDSFKDEHIKGAINIPLADIGKRIKDVPKGKKIIVYCS
jgi:Rhodanese-related sulfurtransferase